MKIAVQHQPATGLQQEVEYRWDPDTDILSAQLSPPASGDGMSGSVGLEGSDGSWLILDVGSGRINVRIARDLLLDIDEKGHISGLWLLNVPPCPTES